MTPGKDVYSNQPKNTPAKTEVFQTPWHTTLLGTKEKLVLIRDRANSIVTAQIVSQNILQRLFPQNKKFTIEKETKFTNISEDRFKEEKLELQRLLAKHASVNDMLQQIEKDLKKPYPPSHLPPSNPRSENEPLNKNDEATDNDSFSRENETEKPEEIQTPTSNPEEIEMRQMTVQALREELENLMNKIRKQEIKPQFQPYERLKKSIRSIKETVSSAFSTFNQLKIDAENPSVSLLDLKKNANALKALNTQWFNQLATIKQTFVEGLSLKEEIDRLSNQIQAFSINIQSQWEELVEELRGQSVSQLASALDVHMVRQKLSRAVAQISQQCKDEATKVIEDSLADLKQHLDATAPVFQEKEKHQTHLDFRKHILTARKKTWASLIEASHLAGNDLEKIAACQQNAAREKTIDEVLAHMLTILPAEEGYLGKLYSIITPFSAMSNPLKAILPASFFVQQFPLLTEKAFLDEASAVYIDHAFRKMNNTIFRLLETLSVSYEEKKSFIEQHNRLVTNPQLIKSDLDSFIDALIRFSGLAANTEDDGPTSEAINGLSAYLEGQKEAFNVLLASREHHNRSFIKKVRTEHPTAFADSTHPAVLQAAETVAKQLFPEDTTDFDIMALSTKWQSHRLSAVAPLKTLKILEDFGRLQEKYQLIEENRRMEMNHLTGEERAKALTHLESLNQAINSLDSISSAETVDASMLAAYQQQLVQADNQFRPLLAIEKTKEELRIALNKEIDGFLAELDTYDSALKEIERYLSIQIKDVRELLNKKRLHALELKNKGSLPSTYMNYAPRSALEKIFYYAHPVLSFDEINVNDLGPSDLVIYIENTKAEIAMDKAAIARSSLMESHTALKAYQEQSKKLDGHIKSLTSAAVKKSNFGGMVEPSSIPSGIDSSHVPKLQFYNALDTETKQKAIQAAQKQTLSIQSNLKFILRQFKADERTLSKLMDQSKKATTLSLLLQIEKLAANPAQQKLAKLTFIETLTTKMAAHSNSMMFTANLLKDLPKVHEEVVRLIDKTKQDLSEKLGYAHSTIKAHAELWEPIRKEDSDNFSTIKGLSVESLTASDLHSYSEMIDFAIKTGSDHMDLIKTAYAKADSASKKYQSKVFEAKSLIKSLDNKDQLISKNKLEYILSDIKKMKENYFGLSAPLTLSEGWFSTLANFMSFADVSDGAQSKPAVFKLLENYKRNIGESIARIDAAINQISLADDMSIPQQLNISPNNQMTEQLRERFHSKTEPLIKNLRESLEKYRKNGTLFKIYGRYIEPSSSFFQEIERAIDTKLMEIERFENGHHSDGILASLFSTPPSELDAGQMEKYNNRLNQFHSSLEQDLDDKFLIKTLRNSRAGYERMKNDHAKSHAAKLRKNGHFTEAHLFEQAISKIEKEEALWEKMVTSTGQLRSLDKALKKFYSQILEAIQFHDPSEQSLTYDEQVKQLLDDKNNLSSPFNFFGYSEDAPKRIQKIESDIIALKTKIISKVETSYEEHQKDLRNLTTELQDIYSMYDIRICPKSKVLQAVDRELYKFSHNQSRFAVTENAISSFFYNPKKIEDMSVEEIALLKPEEKHENLIQSSIKSITDSFNYQLIRTPHTGFIAMLENTEKTILKLKNAGQIIHADDLEGELKRTKTEYDECRKHPIETETDLRNLKGKLNEFRQTLEMAEAAANSQVDYTAIQQLGMLPKNSPHRNDLKKHLVKSIQTKIFDNKTSIKKSLKILDKLVSQLGLPAAWSEAIANKLEESRTEIERAGNGLPVEITGWFINAVSNHSLGELSVDQLAQVQDEVNRKITVLDTLLESHCLKALNEQFEDYETQLNKIQKQKIKWNSAHQVGSAKKLDILVAEKKKLLRAHFSASVEDLPKKMEALQALLRKLTNELHTETATIAKEKPETIALLMQNEELSQVEYEKLRIALRNDMEKKLLAQQTALGDYMKKITTMNDLIRQKGKDSVTFPDAWKILVENKIRLKQKQLKDFVKGLPIIDKDNQLSWKSFDDLSKNEYLQYETLIHRHVKKENDTKTNPISILGRLEQEIQLESIEKFLKIYLQEIKILENSIKQPGINKEKEMSLKAILESNKKLVSSAFNELRHPSDAECLHYTLYQSQASLLRANQENSRNQLNTLDPWASIQKHENSKKDENLEDTSFSKIIKDGFIISYVPKDFSMSGEFPLEVSSLETVIKDEMKYLEDCKDWSNMALATVLKQNAGDIPSWCKPLVDCINITIPQAVNDYESLNDGVPIKNNLGVLTFVEKNNIKTFNQALAYLNHIRSTANKFKNTLQSLKNDNTFYWVEQISETEKALFPTLPSPDADRGSEDALNKFSRKTRAEPLTNPLTNPVNTGPQIIDLEDDILLKSSSKKNNAAQDPSLASNTIKNSSIDTPKTNSTSSVNTEIGIAVTNASPATIGTVGIVQQPLDIPKLRVTIKEQLINLDINSREINIFVKNLAHKNREVVGLFINNLESMNQSQNTIQKFVKEACETIKNSLLFNADQLADDLIRDREKKLNIVKNNIKGIESLNNAEKEFKAIAITYENLQKALPEQLKKLNTSSVQIISLCNIANNILQEPNQGNSFHLTTETTENWRKLHGEIINQIQSVEDIESAVKKIVSLLETCKKSTKSGREVALEKLNITKYIEDKSQAFREDLRFIENEFKVNFAYINTVVVPEIDALKSSYKVPGYFRSKKDVSNLSEDELPYYKTHVEDSLNSIMKNTGIKEAKKAALEFHQLAANMEEAIKHLKTEDKHTHAEQLQTALKTARDQLKNLATNEQANLTLALLTAEIESTSKQLQEKLVRIYKTRGATADLSVQLGNLSEKNEIFKDLKAKLIRKLQDRATEIIEICTASKELLKWHRIIEKIGGNLRDKLTNELNKYLDIAQNFRTIQRSGGMFHYENVSIDDLRKNEFQDYEKEMNLTFKTAREKVNAIQKAILASNKLEIDFQSKANAVKNTLKTRDHYSFFQLDKINKYMDAYNCCKENLLRIAADNSSVNIEKFMEAIRRFESEWLKFENILTEMNQSASMGLLEQLRTSENEGGILTPESIRAIHEIIRKWVEKKIDKAVNKLNEYSKETNILPEQIRSKMLKIIETRIIKLKEFNKDDISKLTLKNIQEWIKPIQATCKRAVSDLEDELQLKKHSASFVEYNTFHEKAKNGLTVLRENKFFALAADLQVAVNTAHAENEALMQKLEELDLKGFWQKFLDTRSNLFSAITSAENKILSDKRSIDEQIAYMRTAYADPFTSQDFISLLSEKQSVQLNLRD